MQANKGASAPGTLLRSSSWHQPVSPLSSVSLPPLLLLLLPAAQSRCYCLVSCGRASSSPRARALAHAPGWASRWTWCDGLISSGQTERVDRTDWGTRTGGILFVLNEHKGVSETFRLQSDPGQFETRTEQHQNLWEEEYGAFLLTAAPLPHWQTSVTGEVSCHHPFSCQ